MPPQTRSKRKAPITTRSAPRAKNRKITDQRRRSPQSGDKTQPAKDEEERRSNGRRSYSSLIFNGLLSDEVYALAYPKIEEGHGEKDWSDEKRAKPLPEQKAGQLESEYQTTQHGDEQGSLDLSTGKPRGYTSTRLTPFAELICAMILSKPLSHRLGLRTIATLFSPPFGLLTPQALEKAGVEGRREALYEARTQHKDKTADQLGEAVRGVRDLCGSEEVDAIELKAVQQAIQDKPRNEAVETVRRKLTSAVKGLGPTGVDIFMRRVQAHPGWEALYPFMDGKTASAAAQFDLIDEQLAQEPLEAACSIDEVLMKVSDSNQEKRRRTFARLLDVLVGLDLEKRVEEVKKKFET